MTDHSDLIERLRAACVGHPRASIAWPHRILHEAEDALSSQSLSLSEAREEIERLRGERDDAARGHELVAKHNAEIEAEHEETFNRLEAAERQRDEALEALLNVEGLIDTPLARRRHKADPFYEDVVASVRSALENCKPALADATNDPASPSLSSLRKGAEVVGWMFVHEDGTRSFVSDPDTKRIWEETMKRALVPVAALVSGSREDGDG